METHDSRTHRAGRRTCRRTSRACRFPATRSSLIYILALIRRACFVCWIADSLGSPDWVEFFSWTTIAYIISRGIAKASRVLEQ